MSDSNILQFPKDKIIRNVDNSEAVLKLKEKSVQNFADALVQEMSESILLDFSNYGIDTDSAEFAKDFIYISTILSATVYRSLDLKHPLHNFLDEQINIKIVESIDMTD